MRYYAIVMVLLVVISAIAVVAQYQQATRYQYTTPRVAYYPTSMCVMVDADQSSPSCYRDAVPLCARANSGYCFQNCAQHVRNICYDTRRIPAVHLPANFEKSFGDRRDCQMAVLEMCEAAGTATQYQDCVRRGNTRCSYIGRMFV